MKIEGKIALVTGGVRGLGLAISEHLFDLGATVVIVDRDKEALENLNRHFACWELDITDQEKVRGVCKTIAATYGSIDILINNAGFIYNEPLVNVMNKNNMMHDYNHFQNILRLNLDSVFIMTSAVVEEMIIRRREGVIVNISSISAHGNVGQTAYSAAKAAVNAMTVTWSKELPRFGIRCNAVAPGFIETESTKFALSNTLLKYVKVNTPLQRLGKPNEIAQAVEALIVNDFINGAILEVNGGLKI